MKYIKTLVGAFVAIALLSVSAVSAAGTSTNTPVVVSPSSDVLGPWTLSLSGGGSSAVNNDKVSSSTVGGEFELGHKGELILPLEAGIRQGIFYSDVKNGSEWLLSTKVYSDWRLFKVSVFEADAGGNVGPKYGDQKLDWTAGPELVGRLYLKKDVNLFGRIEYPFDLNNAKSEGNLDYRVGLQVRF